MFIICIIIFIRIDNSLVRESGFVLISILLFLMYILNTFTTKGLYSIIFDNDLEYEDDEEDYKNIDEHNENEKKISENSLIAE